MGRLEAAVYLISLWRLWQEKKRKKRGFFPPPTHSTHNLFPLLSITTVNLEYISIKTNGVILQIHYESGIWLRTIEIRQAHAFKNAFSLQPACCLCSCSTARFSSVKFAATSVEWRPFSFPSMQDHPRLQGVYNKFIKSPISPLAIQK